MLSIGRCAQLACIWEATARKPGNVHRYRDFDDVTYLDFIHSALAIAPILDNVAERSVGDTVLEGIRATRAVTASNTNLGILLLLAPLAKAAAAANLREGLKKVLASLTMADAVAVYQAIRLAAPGGLGQVAEQDIASEPTETLLQVMARAAERDLVARQYANAFGEIFTEGVPALREGLAQSGILEDAVIHCHLRLMAAHPDALIARKRGQAEADESARRARQVLEAPSDERLAEFDAWLRAEGHSRNPGTTADLVTACLFVVLREGMLGLPIRFS